MARREGQRWGLLPSRPGRLEVWGIGPAGGPGVGGAGQVGSASFLSACIFRFPFPLVLSSCLPCLPPPVPSFSDQLPSPCPFLTCGSPPRPLQLPPALSPFSLLGPLSSPFLDTAPCDATVTGPSLPTSPFPLQSPPSPKLSPQWIQHGKSHGFSYFFSCLNTVLYSQNLKSK